MYFNRILSLGFLFFCQLVLGQRTIQSLNAAWEFSFEEKQQASIVNIPHTWNSEDAFRDGKEYFRGKGIYQKTFFAPEEWADNNLFLHFEGSNQVTTLYVNGQRIGEHRGGYTGFVFNISEAILIGEENEIRIEVDNSHNPDIPPLDADFNFYGGIYRDLWLIRTPQVHFETANDAAGNFLIRTPQVSAELGEMEIEARVVNGTNQRGTFTVEAQILDPQGNAVATLTRKIRLRAGETGQVVFAEKVQNPQLWSPTSPMLYRVDLRIRQGKNPIDEISSKFGFRWFEADPEKGFSLNGKPVKLIGANRHQDFEGLGNALPNRLHHRDYEMIKEMGANFIRTAHYPQDPEVYRICDELGLMVWSEVPVINDVTASDAYHNVSLQMQREQILQFFNHPSVVMWGHMNEIFIRLVFNNEMSEPEKEAKIATSVELAQKLEKLTKELDPSRLSVMALHENELYNTSGIADIPDVIGWNLYFGWYSQGLENFGKFLDEQNQRYPHRPLFISEYGPGADVRIQTNDPKPWDYSEAYQLKLHQSYLRQVMERDYVIGMTAWNFADFGSSFRQDAAPYINQKGLVNMDRSKKDIYHWYRARLQEEPVLYIAGENFEERYVEDETDEVEIRVFSNAENVTLNAAGKTFTAPVKNAIAEFSILLPEGKSSITASSDSLTRSRELEVIYRSNLVPGIEQKDILVNVGAHVQYHDPVTGEVWISDQKYQADSFGYIGGEVYQRDPNKFQGTASDIQGTENDPLFQTMRQNLNSYRFDVEPGTYRVTLLLAEPNFNASEENIYNLSSSEENLQEDVRSFNVKINDRTMQRDLNPARDYGRIRAVTISYIYNTEGGINVEFEPISGEPILSGIKLEKL